MTKESKSVSAAFAQLIHAVGSKFQRTTEYDSVFFEDGSNGKVHVQAIADNFALRPRRLSLLASWLMIAVLLLVAVGIVVFLVPTSVADTSVREEVDEAYGIKEGLLTGEAESSVAFLRARDAWRLLELLDEIRLALATGFDRESTMDGNPYFQPLIRMGLEASRQLNSQNPVAKRFDSRLFQYHKNPEPEFKISSDVFDLVADELNSGVVATVDLYEGFVELNDAIGTNSEQQAVSKLLRVLDPIGQAYETAKNRKDNLGCSTVRLNPRQTIGQKGQGRMSPFSALFITPVQSIVIYLTIRYLVSLKLPESKGETGDIPMRYRYQTRPAGVVREIEGL